MFIMIFFVRNSHDFSLQSQQDIVILYVNSLLKGKNSLRYFGSAIWNSFPNEIRNSEFSNQKQVCGIQIVVHVDCVRNT